ncbi:MAG: ParB/RepB/Spo0J family partition protein [Muribaculaceae bacterium]|nr:ParB/RepB/Spo0J family partition protein [Muribaculaceae bacterium]
MTQYRRNALGRGLDSLISSMGEIRTDGSSAINEIAVDRIEPNPDQPRTTFDEDSIEELAISIRELGIIQPLSLRLTDNGNYQIIAGERRWRAAKLAGLPSVPAYVRTASDSEITEMALIENIQREDLSAIEVALAFKKLIDNYNLTQERLSERLGKKRATIANHLRLLKLPAVIQLALRDRKIDMGHARALLAVDSPEIQVKLYKLILKDDLSVRQVEQMARDAKQGEESDTDNFKVPATAKKQRSAEDKIFAEQLSNYLPTPVKFSRKEDGSGQITLKFNSDDELQQLVALFERLKQ